MKGKNLELNRLSLLVHQENEGALYTGNRMKKIAVAGLGYVCVSWIDPKEFKNAILADLKSIYEKQELIDSGFEVFRL